MTRQLVILAAAVASLPSSAAAGSPPPVGSSLELHAVPMPVESYRLLSMTRDEDGSVWAGSIHRRLHRYDPQAGTIESIRLPYDAVACSCICVGEKVYLLGQSYPKPIVLDRKRKAFAEHAYPTLNPDVWYGSEPVDGHLFLFDRNGGIVRWNTDTDMGEVVPWPYDAPVPASGRFESRDGVIWCQSFDLAGGQSACHASIQRSAPSPGGSLTRRTRRG